MKEKYFINARIIDPSQNLDEVGGLIVDEKGAIKAVGKNVKKGNIPAKAEKIDFLCVKIDSSISGYFRNRKVCILHVNIMLLARKNPMHQYLEIWVTLRKVEKYNMFLCQLALERIYTKNAWTEWMIFILVHWDIYYQNTMLKFWIR